MQISGPDIFDENIININILPCDSLMGGEIRWKQKKLKQMFQFLIESLKETEKETYKRYTSKLQISSCSSFYKVRRPNSVVFI